jgi:hypothetical protein
MLVGAVTGGRHSYVAAVSRVEAQLLELLRAETTHLRPPAAGTVTTKVDWVSHAHKATARFLQRFLHCFIVTLFSLFSCFSCFVVLLFCLLRGSLVLLASWCSCFACFRESLNRRPCMTVSLFDSLNLNVGYYQHCLATKPPKLGGGTWSEVEECV